MKPESALRMLGALAQAHRLDVFRLLVRRGPHGFAAGAIAARLGIPAPTLSFHLKALADAGLVESRREGRFVHYSAAFARMNELIAFLTENCCGGVGAGLCRPTTALRPARRSATAARIARRRS
jgi:DNA-binding transcriptional ArsR family regulator